MYVECKTKGIFAIASLGKKLVFIRKFAIISNNFAILVLKIGLFRRVKELLKWDQTGYGVSHVYLECKTKGTFGIACLGKKLVFHTEICNYFK